MGFLEVVVILVEKYHKFFLEGCKNTLILALFSVLIGTLGGTLLSLCRMSKFKPLKYIAVAIVEFVRGTPLMVQLMFIFYGLPMIGVTFPDISFIPNFSRFIAGLVAMLPNPPPYASEIIRSGIQAVDPGQMEAARSIGFTYGESMRKVILPQAVKNILPALGNEFVTVVKESSIVSVIGIADFMFMTNDVIAVTYRSLQALLIAALLYFVMTFITGRLVSLAERKMKNGR